MVKKAYKGGEVFQNKEISKGVYKLVIEIGRASCRERV